MAHRADEALGHGCLGKRHGIVHARDDVIEFAEEIVIVVETAVLEDIDLASGEKAEFHTLGSEALVERADLRDLSPQARFIKPVGLEGRLRMIGDAEVLQAVFDRGGRHFLEGVFPVARDGVIVKGAAQVFQFDEPGQVALGRSLDLPGVFVLLMEGKVRVVEEVGVAELTNK